VQYSIPVVATMTAPEVLRVHAVIDALGHGGAEALLTDFAVAGRSAGIDVSVGYLLEKDGSPAAARLRAHGVEPVHVPISGLLRPDDLARVRRHVAAVAPDIVHTHLGYADTMAGLAARSLGVPAVSTIHTMEWQRDLREASKLRFAAFVRRRCAACVVTVSEETRRRFLATGWDRAARVRTVHNGVLDRRDPGQGRAVRAELGVDAGQRMIAMLSVIREGKGHDVAIRALAAVRERVADAVLVIGGDGPRRAEAAALAESLVPGGVIFAGHRTDVMAFLDAADVLVHPSRIDAFPTVLLEAMAAGTPIVTSAVGGIPEIVQDGRSGVLLPAPASSEAVARALASVLSDAALHRRLAEGARLRFTAEFSADRWAARLRAVYEDIIARADGQAPPGAPRPARRPRSSSTRP
jgi:glycosyltransferase involved in cell wall biosynthesis